MDFELYVFAEDVLRPVGLFLYIPYIWSFMTCGDPRWPAVALYTLSQMWSPITAGGLYLVAHALPWTRQILCDFWRRSPAARSQTQIPRSPQVTKILCSFIAGHRDLEGRAGKKSRDETVYIWGRKYSQRNSDTGYWGENIYCVWS